MLAEIRRTAADNGGIPPGQHRFTELTGITRAMWRGRFWRTWSDALVEAGLDPNPPPEAHSMDRLIKGLASLTMRLGRFPSHADLMLARRNDKSFPNHQAFTKMGPVAERIELLRRYAAVHAEDHKLLEILPPQDADDPETVVESEHIEGYVYLLKFGKHYKVGRTESVPTRHRQINLELPEKAELVHKIATDDAAGIEAYWHARFASKRANGEWFALGRDDVRAFKRRKFM
jgi:hypothetical protein